MAASMQSDYRVRLIGLGSEILADDAFGILAAQAAERAYGGCLEVVCTSAAGYHLLDHLLGASRAIVVDTILTGAARPGTLHLLGEEQLADAAGGSPHFVGLLDVLAVARALDLPVPQEVAMIAVEASDCTTVGGEMHPDVRAAIPAAIEWVGRRLAEWAGELRHA
jgi:hydrogenase maturation protease